MSDNHHTHDYDENDLIDSPLSQVLQEHNQHVEILIYRLPDSVMCAEKTGGFNLVNYRHSSGVYHEQETEDLHRRI